MTFTKRFGCRAMALGLLAISACGARGQTTVMPARPIALPAFTATRAELPALGDLWLPSGALCIAYRSGRMACPVDVQGIKYDVDVLMSTMVSGISTTDVMFRTPEGASVRDTWARLEALGAKAVADEYGYCAANFPSDWRAQFTFSNRGAGCRGLEPTSTIQRFDLRHRALHDPITFEIQRFESFRYRSGHALPIYCEWRNSGPTRTSLFLLHRKASLGNISARVWNAAGKLVTPVEGLSEGFWTNKMEVVYLDYEPRESRVVLRAYDGVFSDRIDLAKVLAGARTLPAGLMPGLYYVQLNASMLYSNILQIEIVAPTP